MNIREALANCIFVRNGNGTLYRVTSYDASEDQLMIKEDSIHKRVTDVQIIHNASETFKEAGGGWVVFALQPIWQTYV